MRERGRENRLHHIFPFWCCRLSFVAVDPKIGGREGREGSVKKEKQKPRIDDWDALAPHKSTQPHLDGLWRVRGSSRLFHWDTWRASGRGAVSLFPAHHTDNFHHATCQGSVVRYVPLSVVDFPTADQHSTRTRLRMPAVKGNLVRLPSCEPTVGLSVVIGRQVHDYLSKHCCVFNKCHLTQTEASDKGRTMVLYVLRTATQPFPLS